MNRTDQIAGALLGTAVGDALGLPRENISPRRAAKMFGGPPLEHRFLFGLGLGSDDIEHACMTGQALLAAPEDAQQFGRSLAWRLRGWLLGLPAGIGKATLKACFKLWLGFSHSSSGVHSAGNGPIMRAPLLGVVLKDQPEKLAEYNLLQTRLTHTHPLAEQGAAAIAFTAAYAAKRTVDSIDPEEVFALCFDHFPAGEMRDAWETAHTCWRENGDEHALVERLELKKQGVSGYIVHTSVVSLYCWLLYRHDFRRAVESVIVLGGDTDSTAALVGGLAGATLGPESVPASWLARLWEWPRTKSWMRKLAERLAEQFPDEGEEARPQKPLPVFWPALALRNLLFLATVLVLALRRLAPPY